MAQAAGSGGEEETDVGVAATRGGGEDVEQSWQQMAQAGETAGWRRQERRASGWTRKFCLEIEKSASRA